MTTVNDIFYDMDPGDIYGNLPELDESEELSYIEIKYRCSNCKGVMYKRVIVEDSRTEKSATIDIGARVKSKLPIKCLYCKMTVKPEKLN